MKHIFSTDEFNTLKNAFYRCNLREAVQPRSESGKIIDDSDTYNRVQRLLECPEMEEAHGFLYDIDFDHLNSTTVQKINDLYALAIDKGFLQDDSIAPVEEPDFSEDPLTNDEDPDADSEDKAPFMSSGLDSAYTCLYSAMKNGELKTGECFSNAKDTQSAKADAISKLANLGFTSIEIIAVEQGDTAARGTPNVANVSNVEMQDVPDFSGSEEAEETEIVTETTEDKENEEKSELKESAGREVFTVDIRRELPNGDIDPIDDMKFAKTYYLEAEAIADAMKAYEKYGGEDDVSVEIFSEKELPSGDIVGEPISVYTVKDGKLFDIAGNEVEMTSVDSGPWFSEQGELIRKIPEECIKDCTAPGIDAADDVEHWVNVLKFDEDLDMPQARGYLISTGGWTEREVANMLDSEVAEKLLWIICNDLADGETLISIGDAKKFYEGKKIDEAGDEESEETEEVSKEEKTTEETPKEDEGDGEGGDPLLGALDNSEEEEETEETEEETEDSSTKTSDSETEETEKEETEETPEEKPEEAPAEDETSDSDSEEKEDSEEEKSDEVKDDEKFSEVEAQALVEKFVNVWKQVLKNMEQKSFKNLTLDERTKFFEQLSEKWEEKDDPSEFMSDKNWDLLMNLEITL